jgi:hypothetical protein
MEGTSRNGKIILLDRMLVPLSSCQRVITALTCFKDMDDMINDNDMPFYVSLVETFQYQI